MARELFGIALLGALLVSCSGNPSEPAGGANAESVGDIMVPLTTENGGVTYRLQKAQFTISGTTLGTPLVVKPPADTPIDTETLPVGSYSALLRVGWVLERKGAETDATFAAVNATLITPNPISFEVTKGGTTNVFFGFATSVGDVSLGRGNANLRISVQDCTEFNGISAALATYTIDCLGTIDPKAYVVNADGILSRTFDACPLDKTKLLSIDGLLSLQLRAVRLPYAKECLAGRWLDWKGGLDPAGVVCPSWTKQQIVNEATEAMIDKLIPDLTKLAQSPNDGSRPAFLQLLDEGYVYGVAFTNTKPPANQKCQTAGDCATVCAGGLPGFVLRNDATTVLTDGPYWLLDATYPGSTKDPFLKAGYYHPMSYYGPPPGTQFADRHRVAPCPGCLPETCSYGLSNIHIPLRCDCLNVANNLTCPADDTSCVGMCAP